MSWNAEANITIEPGQKPAIEIVADHPKQDHGADESRAAIAAAREAAFNLVETGVLGVGRFSITMNGHSNPDRKPAPGFVNDNVQINIRQLS